MIFTIEASNNYLTKEIVTIVNLLQEIFQSENRLLRQTKRERNELEELLRDPTVGLDELNR